MAVVFAGWHQKDLQTLAQCDRPGMGYALQVATEEKGMAPVESGAVCKSRSFPSTARCAPAAFFFFMLLALRGRSGNEERCMRVEACT